MRDREEPVADEAQLVGEEVVRIASRNDNVLDHGIGGDIGKGFFPTGFDGFIGCLGDGFGVPTDRVGACAIAAV